MLGRMPWISSIQLGRIAINDAPQGHGVIFVTAQAASIPVSFKKMATLIVPTQAAKPLRTHRRYTLRQIAEFALYLLMILTGTALLLFTPGAIAR
jgi:hypothetical protein